MLGISATSISRFRESSPNKAEEKRRGKGRKAKKLIKCSQKLAPFLSVLTEAKMEIAA